MFLVPTDTPGVNIVRNVGARRRAATARARTRSSTTTTCGCRPTRLLGGEGQAFAIAQTRLGGGRIHHAMRTIGMAQQGARHDVRAGAEPRRPQGGLLADKQFVQGYIADSYAQLDAVPPVRAVHGVVDRQAQRLPQGAQGHRRGQGADAGRAARHRPAGDPGARRARRQQRDAVHRMLLGAAVMGLADGPTEVHKVTVARQVLRDYQPSDDLWPTQHLPKRLAAARPKYAEYLEHEVGNL